MKRRSESGSNHTRAFVSSLSRLASFSRLFFGLVALGAGCASPLANRGSGTTPGASSDGTAPIWEALAGGRDDDAARLLAKVSPASDAMASLADASLAFERGDVPRATASYLAVLEAARGTNTPAVAAMAVGRLATLLDEQGRSDDETRALEEQVLRVETTGQSWEVRVALAGLWDRIARRRGDAALLAQVGRRSGCVETLTVVAPLGRLPHLDLDGPVAADAAGAPARTVHATGCRAAIPSFAARTGAQRLFADVDFPEGGLVDVIVSFRGEGRVIVDGTLLRKHGDELSYGPQTSATRVAGRAGHHRIELRLATYGGHPELTLMVVPATTPAKAPSTFAETLAEAYLANQLGDVTRAEAAGQRLEAMPTFALGLAFAAALVRDDPSLPAGFSRDRARTLLRRAVTVDPRLARARNALGGLALDDDRPREALDEALLATKAAPTWWLPWLTLNAAYGLRGLEWDADHALDEALARAPRACAVVEAALSRAETRRDATAVRRFTDATVVCGAVSDDRIARLRRRGDWGEAEKLLRLGMTLEPDPDGMRRDLGRLLLARGRAKEAVALLEPALERTDGEATVAWADAAIAAGQRERARARVASLLLERPDLPQLVRAARTLGVALPLDDYRLDGRAVIRAFEASQRHYAAPAVVILDRSVTRLFPSGAAMTLTHEIVRVQSKDAIQKWGEVALPEGAEILTLRTHKVDGTTREPEEVAGKDAISAADLAIGDYLEKETLELSGPHEAFAPTRPGARAGYLGDRFYFQSFDAPLDRSEYLLVTDPETADSFSIDARAGAPAPVRRPAPRAVAREVVTTFAVTEAPQLFGERSAVPAIEHVPSVRVSVAATWPGWGRFLREQMYGGSRDAAILERAVTEIRAQALDRSPRQLAAALLAWVGQNVEADDDLRGAATLAVASGRGNRVATLIALAHRLGLSARLALGRSRFIAEGGAPTPIEEADDFAEVLVRFDLPGGAVVYVDPRLKHQPFGYLSPGLDGARVLALETGAFETVRTERGDSRDVELTIHLADDGQASGEVLENLRGWPALEWAEIVDRVGSDQAKLRQDFEQRGLGVHFPGAALKNVRVEILGADGRQRDRRETTPTGEEDDSPNRPVTAAEVRIHYTFSSPRFAARDGDRLRILPTFFRSQPGHRYATEPQRATALMTNFDVPTKVVARILLPANARPGGPPTGAHAIARAGAYLFREERSFGTPPGGPPTVTLRREARLSVMRVPPQAYPEVAADLRAVDKLEGEEIVVVLARRTSERTP